MNSAFQRAILGGAFVALALTACGGGGGGGTATPPPPAAIPGISLVSGDIGGAGNIDGAGVAARFSSPVGVATDGAGNAYVIDASNKIRRVSAAGDVQLVAGVHSQGTTFVDREVDGDRSTASFGVLSSIALDPARQVLYVADYDRVRKVTLDGNVSTVFFNQFPGNPPFSPWPSAVAVAPDGAVIVAAGTLRTSFRGRTFPSALYRFPVNGTPTLLAGNVQEPGNADGQGAAARLYVRGMTVDRAGNVYIIANSGALRKVTPDGVVSTLATGIASTLATGIAEGALSMDDEGNILAADVDNRVIRKVTPQGVVSTLYSDVAFGRPTGIATAPGGRVLYTAAHALLSAQPGDPARVVAGTLGLSPNPPGVVFAIGRDSQGNIYTRDVGTFRKFAPDGTPLPFGNGTAGVDVPIRGAFTSGAVFDAADNLYLSYSFFVGPGTSPTADYRGEILRISQAGQVSSVASSRQGPIPFVPANPLPDAAGNVYFIDQNGPAIRLVSAAGAVTTVSDLARFSEVVASRAQFDLALDGKGTLYMSSSRCVVYRIDAAGTPVLFAGQLDKCVSVDGPSSQASLAFPRGLVVDSAGNMYVAESTTIRKITPDGTITTVVGQSGQVGTRLGPLPGTLAPITAGPWLASDDALYVVAGGALLKISLR